MSTSADAKIQAHDVHRFFKYTNKLIPRCAILHFILKYNEIQLFILCPCNICGAERADVQRNTNGWFLIEIILVFFLFVDRYIYLISCHHTYSFIRYFSKLCSSSDKHIDINTLYRGSEGA